MRDVSIALQDDPRIDSWDELSQLVSQNLAPYGLHSAVLRYATQAVENYLICHDLSKAELGALQLRMCDPEVVPDPRFPGQKLNVWAPVYDSDSGVREVRKLRFGTARQAPENPDRWTVTAAHVAGLVRPRGDVTRIRVIELGLSDGSVEVLFNDSPAVAKALYDSQVVPALNKIVESKSVTPGSNCGKCKMAGCCDTLEKLDGFLGQVRRGHATRSVSARDLEIYETCPSQWYLINSNLPGDSDPGPSSERGRNVHDWLAKAHMDNRGCDASDLDFIDEYFPQHLSEEEYLEAREYVTQHALSCPLGDGARVIGSEIGIYGYDARADVVIVSKPDLLYVDADDTFVIRETKTTTRSIPQDERAAFDQFFAVPWLINLMASGYRGPYRSEKARLELEVLASAESRVYAWDLNDSGLRGMAKAEVRLRAKRWHRDTTWSSTPGEHCRWCPVRQWCGDARIEEAETDDGERMP
ncbi:PD-(D/E)XK nuclease family protein [Streptomyces sp. NPDC001222]|uniref:PD-(D/E)XK nuclease family protein n=1 Tax=Streptomyces sp. NPDC001222 TaxID=3364548 RepID=UPI00369D5A1D